MPNKAVAALCALGFLLAIGGMRAQVYTPHITKAGQVNTWNLKDLAAGIYKKYNARTPREKAEAIWRFYLTDGRFAPPGMWYHLLGYAYEEPNGQVLDPIKLLNSYGFGLCYQVAPLLAATYEAGGFKDARVWFLTDHTVAEVFYDGAYHYFDSDLMGYNPVGKGPLRQRDVASVYQIEHDGNIIILKNMTGPKTSNPKTVDHPWYPADVRVGDMAGIASLFTTTKNNYLYAYQRYPNGFTMNFVLRPGERIIRYFHPASPDLFYLPYAYNGEDWKVLSDFSRFHVNPLVGPHSEKDARAWSTGKIEYRPSLITSGITQQSGPDTTYTFSMPSPYVIIDANFAMMVSLPTAQDTLLAETSVDGGRTWTKSGSITGPFKAQWKIQAAKLPGQYGRRNAVAGTYDYLFRLTLHHESGNGTGNSSIKSPVVRGLVLTSLIQLNPRTLPKITPGQNVFTYQPGHDVRTMEPPILLAHLKKYAFKLQNASYVGEGGQGYIVNGRGKPGEVIFQVAAKKGDLTGFSAGGRFLDLSRGIAPNKLTGEIRQVTPWPAHRKGPGTASISWSTNSNGPWKTLWTYNPRLTWLDGKPIRQVLRWPEVDETVRRLPPGTERVYVRYRFGGLAVDKFRLASIRPVSPRASEHLEITQIWEENGIQREFHKNVLDAGKSLQYQISVPKTADVTNVAFILSCPPR
jgi:hypothetical protein